MSARIEERGDGAYVINDRSTPGFTAACIEVRSNGMLRVYVEHEITRNKAAQLAVALQRVLLGSADKVDEVAHG